MHQTETCTRLLFESFFPGNQKPIRGFLASHPSSFLPRLLFPSSFLPSLYIGSFHSVISTPSRGGEGGVAAPPMHAHKDEPLAQCHTHINAHTQLASLNEQGHPAAVAHGCALQEGWGAGGGSTCSKQQEHMSCQGLRGLRSNFKGGCISFGGIMSLILTQDTSEITSLGRSVTQ